MSPGILGNCVSSMRIPTANPYWLKPPRTRPDAMAHTLPCFFLSGSRELILIRRRPGGEPVKIDIFPHIMPRRYFDRMLQVAPPGMVLQKRMSGIPVLVDVEQRLRIMDRYEGYVQVLTLANPPIEVVGSPDASPELARLANDGMAEVVAKHPDRVPGFVASLPMNNPEAAVREIDRAMHDLHATGVQIYTNVAGGPLDLPEYRLVVHPVGPRDPAI